MTIFMVPLCDKCKHFNRNIDWGLSCDAFINGIPEEILTGDHDHREPYPGDNGIMFVQLESDK
jgi:hypothetical protein